MSTAGGNFTLDVQSPDTFMYFKTNGSTVVSLTGWNTIVHFDNNPYGLDLKQNDLYNVNNAIIKNTLRGTHASFVNACFTNVSVTFFMQTQL